MELRIEGKRGTGGKIIAAGGPGNTLCFQLWEQGGNILCFLRLQAHAGDPNRGIVDRQESGLIIPRKAFQCIDKCLW